MLGKMGEGGRCSTVFSAYTIIKITEKTEKTASPASARRLFDKPPDFSNKETAPSEEVFDAGAFKED